MLTSSSGSVPMDQYSCVTLRSNWEICSNDGCATFYLLTRTDGPREILP